MLLSSPRRRGPIATAFSMLQRWCHIGSARRMGPRLRGDDSGECGDDSGESCDQVRQVFPFEIVLFDESYLPIAVPFLQLLFGANSILCVLVGLDVNQAIDTVFADEFRTEPEPVPFKPRAQ